MRLLIPPHLEAKTLHCRDLQPYDGAHNSESSRKGLYLRSTCRNRLMKTRRARPLNARVRRETKERYIHGNNVRGEERNTYHAVKVRQTLCLKRGAKGQGGWAIRRNTREKARNTA